MYVTGDDTFAIFIVINITDQRFDAIKGMDNADKSNISKYYIYLDQSKRVLMNASQNLFVS